MQERGHTSAREVGCVGIGGRLLMRNREVISVIGIRGCPCNGSGARGEGSGHEDSKVS